MVPSRTYTLSCIAIATLALAFLLPIADAQAQRHGSGPHGGGWHGRSWHGGGGWYGRGWHGGGGYGRGWYGRGWYGPGWYGRGWYGSGWGWRGPYLGFGVAPYYYAPPRYYVPGPPAYYPYPYGYAPGYYGGTMYSQQPYIQPNGSRLASLDPNNCGTPDEPKPCHR